MVIYLTAIACFMFYLAAVPVIIAFVFSSKPQPQFKSGTAFFEGRFALRRAMRKKGKKRKLPFSLLSPTLSAGKFLLHHANLEYFRISGVISQPDAAQTAILFGACESLRAAQLPHVQIRVFPDFSGSGSDILFEGMIRLRSGHIILAALIFAQKYLKKRLEKWTASIPLKISCRPPWKASAT